MTVTLRAVKTASKGAVNLASRSRMRNRNRRPALSRFLAELGLPVSGYNGGEAPFDRERVVNARAEDYWTLRELFENGEIDIDELDDVLLLSSARSSGRSTPAVESRSSRRTTCASAACRHLTGPTRSPWRSRGERTAA
jgi:hypothetical protein